MAAAILPMPNRPGCFMVLSSDGETYHECHARDRVCSCPDWQFRQSKKAGLCRHVLALLAQLEALAACPACEGRGQKVPRLTYASGSDPIVCSTCMGSGRRDQADPRLLAVADAYRLKEAAP